MRERRQVADADRSPRGNRGVDPTIQRVDQRAKHRQRDARAALRHPGSANEHDRANALLFHRRTHADRPSPHRVDLEARALVGRERLAGVCAERRGQSVDGLVGIRSGIDDCARVLQALDDRRLDADLRSARDGDDIGDTGAPDAWENGVSVDFGTSSPAAPGFPDSGALGANRAGYFTTPLDLRKSRATSLGSIFSPSTL